MNEKKEIMSFEEISKVDVTKHIEKKMNLSYLSWAWAWQEMKKIDENAEMIVHEFEEYILIGDTVKTIKKPYMNDKGGAWVKVSVKLNGRTETELLPVMDNKNRAMIEPDAMSINKNIKRCFVKALALHGLGIHIYAGEDTADIEPPEKKESKGNDYENKSNNYKKPEITTPLNLENAQKHVIDFGKHKGKTLQELAETEGSYMRWLIKNSKDEWIVSAVKMVGKALKEQKENDTQNQVKQDTDNSLPTEPPQEDPNSLLDGAVEFNDDDLPF